MSCLGEIAYCACIVGESAGGGSVARLLALVAGDGDMIFFLLKFLLVYLVSFLLSTYIDVFSVSHR